MKQNIMLHATIKFSVYIGVVLFLVACGKTKQAEIMEKLPKVKDELLIAKLDSLSKQRPQHFYSKIASKYSDKDLKVSFKTSVRMVADSALNALITFARFPIYNSMVTPDTLTIVDKRNNCYVKEDMGYLKNTFNIDFEHKNIEEFLMGLPVGWDPNEKYHQINDPYNYVISSHNKRSLRKSSKDDSGDVYIRYFLSNDAKQLKRIIIDSPADTTSIMVNYFSYEMVNGYSVPLDSDITVYTPRDTIYVDLKYTKSTINEPSELFLVIPENYTRCE
jgi:hypothetical protein